MKKITLENFMSLFEEVIEDAYSDRLSILEDRINELERESQKLVRMEVRETLNELKEVKKRKAQEVFNSFEGLDPMLLILYILKVREEF